MKTIRAAVERSLPDPKRPRLRESLERRFAPAEARSAAVYADAEAVVAQACRLAEELKRQNNGVVSGELVVDGSLAVKIETATQAARLETEPPE